jgi:hypothetical protein
MILHDNQHGGIMIDHLAQLLEFGFGLFHFKFAAIRP